MVGIDAATATATAQLDVNHYRRPIFSILELTVYFILSAHQSTEQFSIPPSSLRAAGVSRSRNVVSTCLKAPSASSLLI
jgi:hypothetical protein